MAGVSPSGSTTDHGFFLCRLVAETRDDESGEEKDRLLRNIPRNRDNLRHLVTLCAH